MIESVESELRSCHFKPESIARGGRVGEEEKVISPQGMAHYRHPEALGSQYIIFYGYCSSNIYSDNAICRVDELSERGW